MIQHMPTGLCAFVLAMPLLGCATPSEVAMSAPVAIPEKQGGSAEQSLSLNMDYEAAELLLDVLGQTNVTDAQIDRLLTVRGIEAMVDNTTKYVPSHTRQMFRSAVKEFVETRKTTVGKNFRLDESYERAAEIRSLIDRLRADQDLQAEITGPISKYLPPLGLLPVTVYSVVGGASDGFVPEDETEPAFYMALNRAAGDVEGVKLNMVHELYHVAQRAARARVPGLNARVFDPATAPPLMRLLTAVQEEGTATYVAAPMLETGNGPYTEMWREAYDKNEPPEKIAANFAELDRVIAGLHSGTMSWDEASKTMFTGTGSPLYFVGYEMAKAIDARYGPRRIASFAQQHPSAFFRAYIGLYRECPTCVPARFSPATEQFIASLPAS